MAPAKKPAAATVPEEQGPTLKLIVEKGPIAGQIFEFKPGARIQIGRVVRGNSITIKDAGVSSKHVLIRFGPHLHQDPASSSCSWTVTDLDSSNGTIVNDSELQPYQPSVLSDGDVVKIGEMTSIRVKLEVTEPEREGDAGKVRRNPRRGVAGRGQTAVELVVIDEDSDLGSAIEDKNDLKGRAGNGEDVGSQHEGGELWKNDEGKGRGRRSKCDTESRCEQMENVEKANSESLVKGQEECMEEAVCVGEVKGKGGRRGRGRPRVSTGGARSSKEEEKLENLDETRVDDLSLMKAEQRASVRMTRSSRNKGNVDIELDMGVIEGRRKRKGTRGKKNLAVEKHGEEKVVAELNSENEICNGDDKKLEEEGVNGVVKENLGREQHEMREGDKGKLEEEGVNGVVKENSGREQHEICEGDKGKLEEDGVDGVAKANSEREQHEMCEGDKGELEEDGVNDVVKESSGREGDAGLASTSGMKESSVEVIDLERMTLGEWFDHLEVYLPKQIIDETEELILGMRHKVEKLQEFMLQQKNAKEEDGLSSAV